MMRNVRFLGNLSLLFTLACGGSGPGGQAAGGQGAVPGTGGGAGPVVDAGPPVTPGDPGAADVQIAVRSDRDVHPISPLIYGTAQPQNPAENRYTLLRSGGNRMTAYNWENNASNAGSDYMFQNDDYLSSSNTPGEALRGTIEGAAAIGAAAVLTVPIVDYVAADKTGGGDVTKTANYLQTRFKQNRAVKGAALSMTPDASDGYVNQDEFVNWVKTVAAANGPSIIFALDNEPDIWSSTHKEVHPNKVTYDELVMRNITYATMIKNLWPAAPVTGFVSYGWYGYVTLQDAPDRASKGEFIDYYLGKMKAAEGAAGKRLIDYLDLHWYPEATGGQVRITDSSTAAEVVAARVQAPRSLWDPAYVETSWIVDSLGGKAIRLIPRLHEKIAANYPGTGIAITEWNYGGGGHISGAIAVADALGVFGREGVDAASYWALASDESFANSAFRAYRNFDGSGGAFGDTSLYAASTDIANVAAYASMDAANPDRVVIVAINKAMAMKTAAITVAHPTTFARLKVWTITAAGARLTSGADVTATDTNAFRYPMPAMSVSVLVPST